MHPHNAHLLQGSEQPHSFQRQPTAVTLAGCSADEVWGGSHYVCKPRVSTKVFRNFLQNNQTHKRAVYMLCNLYLCLQFKREWVIRSVMELADLFYLLNHL